MKVAIIGTRGIPNNYGGFEQFAEYLSVYLVKEGGYDVTVYNSSNHPYKEKTWNGVDIVHCFDPEKYVGTVGQFIYDLLCILSTRRKKHDIVLQLGYTSSSVWNFLFRKKAIVITNMDGLEWKRSKYSKKIQNFLRYAEKIAVNKSDVLVADSIGIQEYLLNKYKITSQYIAYGADLFTNPDFSKIPTHFNLEINNYDLVVARMEPENNIEAILIGKKHSKNKRKLIVIGNHSNKYGEYLLNKFNGKYNITFIGGIYDREILNNIRYYCNIYFHGHSVGGTNPSLLEAMACSTLLCAHNNIFNEAILNKDAYYFENENDLAILFDTLNKANEIEKIENNIKKVTEKYSWNHICKSYNSLIYESAEKHL